MKTKQCKTCFIDFPLDCFYQGTCSDGKSSRCKHCTKAKVTESRDFKKEMGLSTRVSMAEVPRDNGYLDRHRQRREEEAAIEASLMRGTQESSPKHYLDVVCLNEPKTVFGDQINSLLRRPRRYFKWRIS